MFHTTSVTCIRSQAFCSGRYRVNCDSPTAVLLEINGIFCWDLLGNEIMSCLLSVLKILIQPPTVSSPPFLTIDDFMSSLGFGVRPPIF